MEFALAALTFAVVAAILLLVISATGAGRREDVIRRRLDAIDKGTRRGSDSLQFQVVRDEVLSEVPFLNRMLMRWPQVRRLREFMAQAGLKMKPGKLILLSVVLALGAYLLVQRFNPSPIVTVLGGAGGLVAPLAVVALKRKRRLRAFDRNFPEAIDMLGRAVRAGHSFTTGLQMIGSEVAEPVAGEFRATFEEQNFGLPLRDALLNLAERVPLIDVQFFVTALMIQKDTGGNLAEILDNLAHVVRERFRILGEVRIRTAQGRLTAGILMALPLFMIVTLRIMNPDYVNLLFTDPWGPYMLGGAATLQALGSIMLWRIVNIDV